VKTSLTSPPLLVGDSAAPANFQDHFQQFFSLGQLKADGGKIHCDITMLGNLARQDPQYSSTSQHFVWKLGWRPISCLFAKVSSCRQATVKLAVRLVKFRTICSKMAWNFEMAVIRFVSVVELPYYYWWIFRTDSVSHSVARTLVDPLVVPEITQ
jgi:hypothetical protein